MTGRLVIDPRRDPRDLRGIERFRLPVSIVRAIVAIHSRLTRWHVDRDPWDWQTEEDYRKDIAYAELRDLAKETP